MTQPIGYLYDPAAQEKANARGENCWSVYVQEIFAQLGAPAEAVTPTRTKPLASALEGLRVLVVGDSRSADLADAADDLTRWVEAGGTLVGLGSHGLDGLFGNAFHSMTPEPGSPYHATALARFEPHRLTTGVCAPQFVGKPLPLFGPLRKVVARDTGVLAWLFSIQEGRSDFPALTHRRVGQGHAYYSAFDLAQTLWVIHKGRPVDGDYDLDGYYRLSDAVAIGALSQNVPYADELLFLLQNVLHQAGIPLVHQLPPTDGQVADLVLYFGGDDEGLADGSQCLASEFMKSRGLPYHINIMPNAAGKFALSAQEHDQLLANGHETSLHYNFIDGFQHPGGFRKKDVKRQWDLFVQAFGRKPVATVNHCCRWTGWAEPARWMRAVGGRADNSRAGVTSPPLNPTGSVGFAFGTSFPHYYYDDWRSGNPRIDFLCEPIGAYEVGYQGEATDFGTLHDALDLAGSFHLTMNFFYHPYYFAHAPGCMKAVEELKRYLQERALKPVFFGCDALWAWWDARARSRVEVHTLAAGQTRFRARCAYPQGMVVKVPVSGPAAEVTVGGRKTPAALQTHCGLPYAMVVCPAGESEVAATTVPAPQAPSEG
ncbi:MAG: hypothetical protein COZ06_37765 [Armatimonadetes bacterium CG_4_10_14_3_um_filter_66_18]|nr:hypothetical protein [Armatimonadota bacterium]OIO98659.1 MAG: hypothetical protein AUJ96_20760 [Armatimonadetes bacterium CG2_30_66_41]PIU94564.1 MAG: hypothetical protein COS65_06930 [Armatimonadetes bacterium CG06_land_8_20_14_3_00_66_21]PIX43534.1 MAG: hypothetical protein COZ57_19025 [Armatimonadetes bacterium CG_4_8_14_3_um_filter_66_20]PIY35668.1 MAG: hypothetical protein COZ06_37765 [Armatimonadetes bacterium CG_4_10_14_3_um_filter_66_18]PIZ49520.1 MAG: hypothetical protein COY42_03